MEEKYRCLTCYTALTKEEYEQHKDQGHTTVEYIILDRCKHESAWFSRSIELYSNGVEGMHTYCNECGVCVDHIEEEN